MFFELEGVYTEVLVACQLDEAGSLNEMWNLDCDSWKENKINKHGFNLLTGQKDMIHIMYSRLN